MAKDKKPEGNRIVFSTNPNFKHEPETTNDGSSILPNQQTLYISLERLKGGKVATVIDSFKGTSSELENLGKQVKSKCGVGGTAKDGIILIQGEQRDKVIAYLGSLGYKTKKKGG